MILILIAIPADAMICTDMFSTYIHCHSCWCKPCEWIRIEWIRMEWIRMNLRIAWIHLDVCFAFIYIAIPAEAYFLRGYVYWMDTYGTDTYELAYCMDTYWCMFCNSYTLPFLLMHTFWRDTCWMDTCWRDTYWMDTYWWDTYWRHTYCWDTYWVDAYTPTIFRRTLRRNVFRERKNVCCANTLPWNFLHFTHTSIWWTGTYSQHDWVNLSQGSDEKRMICWTIGCDVVILQTACDFFKGWQDHVPFISRRGLDLLGFDHAVYLWSKCHDMMTGIEIPDSCRFPIKRKGVGLLSHVASKRAPAHTYISKLDWLTCISYIGPFDSIYFLSSEISPVVAKRVWHGKITCIPFQIGAAWFCSRFNLFWQIMFFFEITEKKQWELKAQRVCLTGGLTCQLPFVVSFFPFGVIFFVCFCCFVFLLFGLFLRLVGFEDWRTPSSHFC